MSPIRALEWLRSKLMLIKVCTTGALTLVPYKPEDPCEIPWFVLSGIGQNWFCHKAISLKALHMGLLDRQRLSASDSCSSSRCNYHITLLIKKKSKNSSQNEDPS